MPRGRDRTPTQWEARFLNLVLASCDGLQVWMNEDDDGTPWVCVSFDVLDARRRAVARTLRVDYDGSRLRGGVSPSALSWDDGVRAEAAGIATRADGGLHADDVDPPTAARLTIRWFATQLPGA